MIARFSTIKVAVNVSRVATSLTAKKAGPNSDIFIAYLGTTYLGTLPMCLPCVSGAVNTRRKDVSTTSVGHSRLIVW